MLGAPHSSNTLPHLVNTCNNFNNINNGFSNEKSKVTATMFKIDFSYWKWMEWTSNLEHWCSKAQDSDTSIESAAETEAKRLKKLNQNFETEIWNTFKSIFRMKHRKKKSFCDIVPNWQIDKLKSRRIPTNCFLVLSPLLISYPGSRQIIFLLATVSASVRPFVTVSHRPSNNADTQSDTPETRDNKWNYPGALHTASLRAADLSRWAAQQTSIHRTVAVPLATLWRH